MKKIVQVLFLFVSCLFLFSCSTTNVENKKTDFEQDKEIIYKVLSQRYAGYPEMRENGFTKKKWFNLRTYNEMSICLNVCVNDAHLSIRKYNTTIYQGKTDPKTNEYSNDPKDFFNYIETSNTMYIRSTSCVEKNKQYMNLKNYARKAKKFNFIILDFRSNHQEQIQFLNRLIHV